MKKIILMILISVMIVTLSVATGNKEEAGNTPEGMQIYVFAVDSTWPPMEYIDIETNEIIGFDVDLVKAIAKAEGFEVKFVTVAWDGIFAGLEIGDYDGISSSVTITEERGKKMLFSDPYFNAGQLLAIRKDSAGEIKGLGDLAGREVAVQIGTSAAELVANDYPDVKLKTYQDLSPAAAELANGNIDGLVADTPLVSHFLLKNEKYKDIFVSVGEPMTTEEYGFAFPLDSTELRDKMNSGLKKVKADGTYDKLYKQWIE